MDKDTFSYKPEYDSDLMIAYRNFLIIRDNNENQDYLIDRCFDEANSGDALYQCVLGYLYYFRVVSSDKGNDIEAERMFKLAAQNGSTEALYALAMTRFDEDCLFEDEDEGFEMLEEVAKTGYVKAINVLGVKMHNSDDESRQRKSLKYLRLAAERGYIQAKLNLINIYGKSDDIEEAKNAFKSAKELSLEGCAQAQYDLGIMYEEGTAAVEQDDKKSFKWYKQAADLNHPKACLETGNAYFYGNGTEENGKLAIKYYSKAIELGVSDALIKIGLLNERGCGDYKPNIKLAMEYYTKGVKAGLAVGNFYLGCLYYFGEYIEGDDEKAFKYFTAGADEGNLACITKIGECYAYGFGCEQDVEKGIDILKDNADNDDDDLACSILARIYAEGKITKKNEKLAREYIKKGESLGANCDKAREALGEIIGDESIEQEPENDEPVIRNEVAVEENDSSEDEELFDKACDLYDKDMTKEAFEIFERLADAGNIDAIGILAHIYWGLIGNTPTNYTKAFDYASRGTKVDDPASELVYGLAKYYGKGTNQSTRIGLEMIEKAAETGVPIAYHELGAIYYYGEKVTNDENKAIEYLRKAISEDENDVRSYKLLGTIYGKKVNYSMPREISDCSIEYNNKAVELDPEWGKGYYYLGMTYLWQSKNDLAFENYNKGADLKDGDSCYWLAHCYKYGQGCTKDRYLARYYNHLAKEYRGY